MPGVYVRYAAVSVLRELSENFHMFSQLMLFKYSFFMLKRRVLHLLSTAIIDLTHLRPAVAKVHFVSPAERLYAQSRTEAPGSPCHLA